MIFHSSKNADGTQGFVINGDAYATANACLNNDTVKTFWSNFTHKGSTLNITECDKFVFSVGNTGALSLDGCDYTIKVDKDGISVLARGERELVWGFMTLLDLFAAIDGEGGPAISVKCCQIKESALIKNRMVHFCIFPETELWELQRFVRLCGALKYTHIILEFWGMLKYDCMKELAWSHGFTKEQIRPIIKEANELCVEVIPMFNHWGHAAAGRIMHGKHVVLDQNPTLQTYFSEDGWCWDIKKEKVRTLLRQIRGELCELCGEGEYFHIGCDEATGFEFTKENTAAVCDFINEISEEMKLKNRRAIMWGDMLLYKHPHYNPQNGYCCNAPTPEVEEYMLSKISHDVVIADWQYTVKEAPVETAEVFKKAGFDCLICPWDRGVSPMQVAISTAKSHSLMGVLHTTWHTLSKGVPCVALVAMGGFKSVDDFCDWPELLAQTAGTLRRVMPPEGDYKKSGWSKIEICDLC